MKRVLCLRFPDWPVQRLHLSGSAESHQPAALVCAPDDVAADPAVAAQADYRFLRRLFPSFRTGPAVIAVNEWAWGRGVRPGMPLAEARSMGSGRAGATSAEVQFYPWTATADRQMLTDLAEEVRAFAPVIGLDELPVPDCLLLDITGCGPLFGGEVALAEQLVRRLRIMGIQPRAAISDTVATAWAVAHADQRITAIRRRQRQRRSAPDLSAEWRLPVIIIPPGQAAEYLAELPVSAGRFHPDDIEILEQLGILTLQRTLQLPRDDLPTRLSADAVRRIHQLLGTEEEQIVPLPESDPVCARWMSEFPAGSRDAVRQVLEHLCEHIAEQLIRRQTGASSLECTLQVDDQSVVSLQTEFVRPVQTAEVMLEMLILRMESLTIPGPVISVSARAGLSPLPVARQKDLFSSTEHLRPQEDLAVLLNRMNSRLGKQSALRVELTRDSRPESAVRFCPVVAGDAQDADDRLHQLVTPEDADEQSTPQYHRPVRLFASPLPMTGLQPSLQGATFRYAGHTESIVQVTGPERLQTAWWDDTPVHRDYYRVRTSGGSAWWLFRELQTGSWFLHGIFD